ncbi:hypothetical protein [Hespellia stercorisuis]|nr:hypothetical protein [Hespellia stercorisuis]
MNNKGAPLLLKLSIEAKCEKQVEWLTNLLKYGILKKRVIYMGVVR